MPVSIAWISGFVFLGDLVPPVEAVPVRFQCHAQEDSCVWILRWNGTIGLDSDGVCISVCVSSSIAVCYCWERELWMRRFSAFQIFQDPTAMMQQLLTTSRQLTLGAYKHETECMYSYIQHCFKKQNKKAFTSFESLCLHVCAFLQSVNWSRGPRRNWKWQRREQAKRSRSWKTNSKPAERTSTTLRQRLENWKRTETIKSTERRTNMLMDAISCWSNFLCSCPLQGFNKQKKVSVVICLRIFAFYFCWASKGILNM